MNIKLQDKYELKDSYTEAIHIPAYGIIIQPQAPFYYRKCKVSDSSII